MSKDHEHEERRLLARLRRRRASGTAPSSNLFTARATDAPSPVPPPAEPPPERLFDGVDRWDAPDEDGDDDVPLFSEASLDTGLSADEPLAPPPPAPVPPAPIATVPDLPPPPDEHDDVDELFATPSAPTADDASETATHVTPPAAVDFWATPVRPAAAEPAAVEHGSPQAEHGSPQAEHGSPQIEPAPPLIDHAPEVVSAEAAAPDVPPPPPVVEPPATIEDAPPPIATPTSLEDAPPPTEPPAPPVAPSLAETVAPLDPLSDVVAEQVDTPELSDLTDELHRYAAEEPETVDESATGLWSHLAEPYARTADPEPVVDEPDEQPMGNLFAAQRPAPADERSPLLDQVAAEFGDPRAELHRMVESDPEDLPAAASSPTPSPAAGMPMTGDEPLAPAPAFEEPAATAFPPTVAPDPEVSEVEEPEPWVSPAPSEDDAAPTTGDHDDVVVLDEPAAAAPSAPEVDAPAAVEPEPAAPAASATAQDAAAPAAAGAVPLGSEPATHGPSIIRVHDDRLDNRPGPIKMSPSEAVALAEEGPGALHRRRKPS